LSSINLSDCQHISDRGLIRIATQLGRLEVLRLSKCRVRAQFRFPNHILRELQPEVSKW
uniref:F-box/LRR-repeat protein 14 n=1 Tax=Taenia asiatica TaxID=60517 RepID=A0A0R3VV02_TAEAS